MRPMPHGTHGGRWPTSNDSAPRVHVSTRRTTNVRRPQRRLRRPAAARPAGAALHLAAAARARARSAGTPAVRRVGVGVARRAAAAVCTGAASQLRREPAAGGAAPRALGATQPLGSARRRRRLARARAAHPLQREHGAAVADAARLQRADARRGAAVLGGGARAARAARYRRRPLERHLRPAVARGVGGGAARRTARLSAARRAREHRGRTTRRL